MAAPRRSLAFVSFVKRDGWREDVEISCIPDSEFSLTSVTTLLRVELDPETRLNAMMQPMTVGAAEINTSGLILRCDACFIQKERSRYNIVM